MGKKKDKKGKKKAAAEAAAKAAAEAAAKAKAEAEAAARLAAEAEAEAEADEDDSSSDSSSSSSEGGADDAAAAEEEMGAKGKEKGEGSSSSSSSSSSSDEEEAEAKAEPPKGGKAAGKAGPERDGGSDSGGGGSSRSSSSSDSDSSEEEEEEKAKPKGKGKEKEIAGADEESGGGSSSSDSSDEDEEEEEEKKDERPKKGTAAGKDDSDSSDSDSSDSEDDVGGKAEPPAKKAKVSAGGGEGKGKDESSSAPSSSSDSNSDESTKSSEPPQEDEGQSKKRRKSKGDGDGERPSKKAAVVPPDDANSQIFVKYLPWLATVEEVGDFFSECDGGAAKVEIVKESDGRSTGTAVVTMKTAGGAAAALEMDGATFGDSGRWVGVSYHDGTPVAKLVEDRSKRPEGCVTVFIANLSFDIDEETVKETFKDCGEITNIKWGEDRETGRFKGYAFVEFREGEAAERAFALTGTNVMGRTLKVAYSQGRNGGGGGRSGGSGGMSGGRQPTEKPEGCVTVFVGNLSFDIDEEKLKETFKDCGEIRDIRWGEDRETGRFKGFAFVEFHETKVAERAFALSGTNVMGRPMKVDYAQGRSGGGGGGGGGSGGGGGISGGRQPTEKPEGCVTVFIANLSFDIDEETVKEIFKDCGEIRNIRWGEDRETGRFKGYAHVEFHETEAAERAFALSGTDVMGRPMRVDYAQGRSGGGGDGRSGGGGGMSGGNQPTEKPEGCVTVFVGNLTSDIDEETLKETFKDCGGIGDIRWAEDKATGRFKGYAHMEFHETEAAEKAVALAGTEVMGQLLKVDYAQSKNGGGGRGGGGGGRGFGHGGGGRGFGRGGGGGFGRGGGGGFGGRGRGGGRGGGGRGGRGGRGLPGSGRRTGAIASFAGKKITFD